MKQTTIFILAILLGINLVGCVKDLGNYDYQDPNDVAPTIISGIEPKYSALSLAQFDITPDVKGDTSKYEYVWYAFPGTIVSSTPYDTLGTSKKLSCVMPLSPGTYQLVFKVTNTENNTSAFHKTTLTVSSYFSQGYYILKYQDGVTDVDLIDRNGVLNTNIIKTLNGESIPGKPIRSAYEVNQYAYYVYDFEGNRTRKNLQPAYMICTDEDLRIYHGEDIKLLKKWQDAFLEVPTIKKPQGIWATSGGWMLLNNNAPRFFTLGGAGDGVFGYEFPTDGMKISDVVGVTSSSCMCFDENAGELVGFTSGNRSPIKSAVETASPMVLKPVGEVYFTNCDLICMGTQKYASTSAGDGYAIFKNRTTGEAKFWQLNYGGVQQGYIYDYGARGIVIPSDFDVINGKVFAIQGYGILATPPRLSAVIYYTKGNNIVQYYNPSNNTEKKNMITIPSDEEIVYLEHSSDSQTKVDIFNILSNKGGNWVLRTYNRIGSTPDIDPTVINTYTGTGLAKNFIYRYDGIKITY